MRMSHREHVHAVRRRAAESIMIDLCSPVRDDLVDRECALSGQFES